MIVSRIDGGLGNQMFQYAFGLQFAKEAGTDLVLDLSSYRGGPVHGYMLDRLCIEAREATTDEAKRFPGRYGTATGWHRFLQANRLTRIKEKPFGMEPIRPTRMKDNTYLVGYWQSEEYFTGVAEDLKHHFRVRVELSDLSKQIADRMWSRPSMALHIRRGDYLTSANQSIFDSLTIEYYQQAAHRWLSQTAGGELFVFSNDIPWCREQLNMSCLTHFVDHTNVATAHEDLHLMSQANAIAIANSTFSWWGAWLSQRDKPVVYAPSSWFRSGTLDGRRIIPKRWSTIHCVPTTSVAA